MLGLQTADVGGALESIRVQAVNRGKGNKRFREMNLATLELLLPRESRKVRILHNRNHIHSGRKANTHSKGLQP